MKSLLSLLLAIVFGCVAAFLNYVFLQSKEVPLFHALSIKKDPAVKPGSPLTLDDFGKADMPIVPEVGLTPDYYRTLFLRKEDQVLVEGLTANRELKKGEPILKSDFEAMVSLKNPEFKLLRFRVLAVGDRIKTPGMDSGSGGGGGNISHVTIAVIDPDAPQIQKTDESKKATGKPKIYFEKKKENSLRLIRYTLNSGTKTKTNWDPILGVAVFPREISEEASMDQFSGPNPGEMALTVPLQGIPSVPNIILVGGEIGFFMPGGK